ncbi:hypothetical protein EG328_010201 [Venturia inaequalis]|uniref:Uncharacterized protein n=1 Tax=Venturia inaequalis TaxID=5025 RepID=A0A8H3U7C8_VENIN|nr:hypothetical protein EG328_010201 [Venturia inaequalis]
MLTVGAGFDDYDDEPGSPRIMEQLPSENAVTDGTSDCPTRPNAAHFRTLGPAMISLVPSFLLIPTILSMPPINIKTSPGLAPSMT